MNSVTRTKGLNSTLAAMITLVAIAAMTATTPVLAKSKRYTVTADYCKETQPDGSPNPCAALVYGVGSVGYYVTKVTVNARGDDNQISDFNTHCEGWKVEQDMDLRTSEYGVWIVPAPCSYKLEMKIGGGDEKGQHVFLSPGCELALESGGTTLNDNKPKLKKVVWTDDAKTEMAAKGITVDNSDVSDQYYQAALGQNVKHYCNKDDDRDKNPN